MSSISCGIVGLPNIGKSTLFNALLKKQQALAANYPFATIEPNVGIVPVPDIRLDTLAEITKEELKLDSIPPIKYATVEFYDIAGLVKGASEGAGLGNKFLSHIREVSVIVHVVREFQDSEVIREGSVSVEDDYQTIQLELSLADLQTLQKSLDNRRIEPMKKTACDKLVKEINLGKRAIDVSLTDIERESIKELNLFTNKPEIILINVGEDKYNDTVIKDEIARFSKILNINEDKFVVISAKVESELAELTLDDQKQYLKSLGIQKAGLERLIIKAYDALNLMSFLTAGEKEVKAWTIRKGTNAQYASGEIHTDFIKRFIKAEIISYDDFLTNKGWKKSRELGRARLEGKDYIMKDGDIVEFKIGS